MTPALPFDATITDHALFLVPLADAEPIRVGLDRVFDTEDFDARR